MEKMLLEQIREQNLLIEKLLREKEMNRKSNKKIKKHKKNFPKFSVLQVREYIIKKILDHRQLDNGNYEFFVEWENVDNQAGIRNWIPEQESFKTKIEEYFNAL
jgi:hypothetical protein